MLVAPPEMSPLLHQSIGRLSQDLVSQTVGGRKSEQFARSADYELNLADTAGELRAFNANVRSVFPKDVILTHGSHKPNQDAPVLSNLSKGWKEFAHENWERLFAAQWAETQVRLKPLGDPIKALGLPTQDEIAQTEKKAMPSMTPENQTCERILIEAFPDMPPLPEHDIRQRASGDISARPTLATARDIAGRIYIEPDKAVDQMVARYQADGSTAGLVSEVERAPENFGELRGTTRFGIVNAERRSALEQAPIMAEHMQKHLTAVSGIEERVVEQYDAERLAMQKPLPDLSPEASQFLEQVNQVDKLPTGARKDEQMRGLLTDKASIQEVSRFRQHLTARYGSGRDAIRQGIENDPALKARSASERSLVQARVATVVEALPVLTHMRETIRQRDRGPDIGKYHGRGIER